MAGPPPLDDEFYRSAQQALDGARIQLERLRTGALEQYDHDWRMLLDCLGKVPEKLKNGYSKSGGTVGPWVSQQLRLLKNDQLLRYLFHARHMDEHRAEDAVENKPGAIGLGPGPSGRAYIKKLRVNSKGGKVTLAGQATGLMLKITPGGVEVLEVRNRGATYSPPESHLGQPIGSRDPIRLAELAINHYEGVLDEFERRHLASTATPSSR